MGGGHRSIPLILERWWEYIAGIYGAPIWDLAQKYLPWLHVSSVCSLVLAVGQGREVVGETGGVGSGRKKVANICCCFWRCALSTSLVCVIVSCPADTEQAMLVPEKASCVNRMLIFSRCSQEVEWRSSFRYDFGHQWSMPWWPTSYLKQLLHLFNLGLLLSSFNC